MLDERCKSRCAAPAQMAVTTTTHHTDIAASPRVQEMRHERMPGPVLLSSETVSYRATGSDGITASPRLRAQLDEHRQAVEIAPLK